MGKTLMTMKAQQCRKISELRDAIIAAGFRTIDEQSHALGVCRSTAWTILKAIHKSSGLSAAIINRMLAAPQLPWTVRAKIFEYVGEKASGQYGHSPAQCRKFIAQISVELLPGDGVTLHQFPIFDGANEAPPFQPPRSSKCVERFRYEGPFIAMGQRKVAVRQFGVSKNACS